MLGELQKRIKAIYDEYWAEDISSEWIMEIVEEMRKEFPLVIPGLQSQDSEGNIERGQDWKNRWVDGKEALKWFEKWFGKPK